MIQKFISYLKQHIDLDDEDAGFISEVLTVNEFSKGELLLKQGDISKTFYFNLSGLVRLYYLKDGEERTAYFYPERTFVSAYSSFVRQEPSKLNFQAVTDIVVIEISLEASVKLLNYSSKFEIMARIAMEEELMNHQDIIESLLTLKPEERYYDLLKKNPEIFQQVPQHYIASYIGVKPESLSRIKKRHFEKNS